MAERRRIKGPITGYEYQMVNAILDWIREWRERWRQRLQRQLKLRDVIKTTTKTESKTKIYSNIETYEIFEDKAGVIKVRVHRKAERGS